MIRKSFVVFVICVSLALAISLGAAVDNPSTEPTFLPQRSWIETLPLEAGCKPGERSKR